MQMRVAGRGRGLRPLPFTPPPDARVALSELCCDLIDLERKRWYSRERQTARVGGLLTKLRDSQEGMERTIVGKRRNGMPNMANEEDSRAIDGGRGEALASDVWSSDWAGVE